MPTTKPCSALWLTPPSCDGPQWAPPPLNIAGARLEVPLGRDVLRWSKLLTRFATVRFYDGRRRLGGIASPPKTNETSFPSADKFSLHSGLFCFGRPDLYQHFPVFDLHGIARQPTVLRINSDATVHDIKLPKMGRTG